MKPESPRRAPGRTWAPWLALAACAVGCEAGTTATRSPNPAPVAERAPALAADRIAEAAPDPTAEPTDPAEAFATMEAGLTQADQLTAHCTLEASGAVEAKLEAELTLGPGNQVGLVLTGDFTGDEVSAELGIEAGELHIVAGGEARRGPIPPALREAVVVGLTRMGLLHNAAMLIAGEPPDRAEGGVRDWVDTTRHRWTTAANGAASVLTFDLIVSGGVPATAKLVLDEHGLPAHRTQEVHFEAGTMAVTETCRWSSPSI